MYERIESLGKGTFGTVWMAKRVVPPEDEYDDEYVALKNISMTEENSYLYAQREICILTELRHPNVIRMIRAFPIWKENSQLLALQLARGPNLNYLVQKRGALGLPVARLVARHLIAAVGYLHGRAVLHRDIKPTNCILASTQAGPCEEYDVDWLSDDVIWSDGPEASAAVARNRWKLMLVDFGFARALDESDLHDGTTRRRHSIANESPGTMEELTNMITQELYNEDAILKRAKELRGPLMDEPKAEKRLSMLTLPSLELSEIEAACNEMSSEHPHDPTSGPTKASATDAKSSPKWKRIRSSKRKSVARSKVRSMSALGSRAYAAPEIKHDFRDKTDEDKEVAHEALTNCVADYGMNVDAFSVGWTLRVILTGVPPKSSISSFFGKMAAEEVPVERASCLCFRSSRKEQKETRKVRDVPQLPKEAIHLISELTKRNADDRMTVREAQSHPYISGLSGETPYELPLGDIPAKHGDPVVPLKCAKSL
jgi:serine/threonine protein kinase